MTAALTATVHNALMVVAVDDDEGWLTRTKELLPPPDFTVICIADIDSFKHQIAQLSNVDVFLVDIRFQKRTRLRELITAIDHHWPEADICIVSNFPYDTDNASQQRVTDTISKTRARAGPALRNRVRSLVDKARASRGTATSRSLPSVVVRRKHQKPFQTLVTMSGFIDAVLDDWVRAVIDKSDDGCCTGSADYYDIAGTKYLLFPRWMFGKRFVERGGHLAEGQLFQYCIYRREERQVSEIIPIDSHTDEAIDESTETQLAQLEQLERKTEPDERQ